MTTDEGAADAELPRIRIRLERVTDWETLVVEARYSPNELARRCGYSMRHMQRFMIGRYRMTLGEFVTSVRMTKAYNLLRLGFTIKETALGLGFKQVSHFCRCFRQHFNAKASTVIVNLGGSSNGTDHENQLELDFLRPNPSNRRGK